MQPLEYKNIGGEEHLTFDSIRGLVLRQLSATDEQEASKHIDKCPRCQGIYKSLARPSEIRQENAPNVSTGPLLLGLGLVAVLIIAATSILYFGKESKPAEEKIADFSKPGEAETVETPEVEENTVEDIPPIVVDTLTRTNDEPIAEEPELPTNKQFDQYIEKEQREPQVRLRGIYGEITADGTPLPGVTVKVPGYGSERVTDADGKYYIQVPRDTKSLLFIYRGKQLTKELDPNLRRLDIRLKSESLHDSEPGESENKVES